MQGRCPYQNMWAITQEQVCNGVLASLFLRVKCCMHPMSTSLARNRMTALITPVKSCVSLQGMF